MSASYLPTDAASLVISVAAVPKAIVSSRVLFAAAIAEDDLVKNSTISSFDTAWVFCLLLSSIQIDY